MTVCVKDKNNRHVKTEKVLRYLNLDISYIRKKLTKESESSFVNLKEVQKSKEESLSNRNRQTKIRYTVY